MVFKLKKQNQLGFTHYIIPVIGVLVLFGVLGTYLQVKSHAASNPVELKSAVSSSSTANWCLNDENSSIGAENPINSAVCSGSNAQLWSLTGGTIKNTALSGTHCIEPKNGATKPGSVVVMDTCNGHPTQNWTSNVGGGLQNTHSGLCLTVPTTRVQLEVTTCDPASVAQKWQQTVYTRGDGGGTHYKYIAVKDIPVAGLQVGATFYGALGAPVKGHYVVSNLRQGGTKDGGAYNGYDDNGVGACGGKYNNLTNQSTWAEDGLGKILGDVPCGTKLLLTYNGHTVVAEKGDISGGGCDGSEKQCAVDGHERAIDLWWQTAKALCFSNQPAAITIHAVPQSTRTTSIIPYDKNNPATTAVCH